LFSHVTKFFTSLDNRKDLNTFSEKILFAEISDDFFFDFGEISLLFGIIAKRNIKLIFGLSRDVKCPFYSFPVSSTVQS